MSNQIVEEVPTQAPAAGGGAQEKLEKQARQLAYDVKYKVKQQMNRGTKLDPAAVKKAYISFLGRATGSPQVKALAKKKLLGEGYIDVDQFVQDSIVKALVSNKEMIIPKVIAEQIGYDRLEKINNRGKERVNEIKFGVNV